MSVIHKHNGVLYEEVIGYSTSQCYACAFVHKECSADKRLDKRPQWAHDCAKHNSHFIKLEQPQQPSLPGIPEPLQAVDPNYESLAAVLRAAYDQAATGKGAERHGNGLAFDVQPMQKISWLLGSADGMAFQACKKVAEGLKLPTLERQEREILGAINYLAGIVIFLRARGG